eukprot:NODE_957_length_2903_cov_0.370542.p3 type:complete len:131 gc:universal NODE_957_length_2903_cov_0.370542:377-769(+)
MLPHPIHQYLMMFSAHLNPFSSLQCTHKTNLKYSVYLIHLESILTRRIFLKSTTSSHLEEATSTMIQSFTKLTQTTMANVYFKPNYKLNEFLNFSILSIVKLVVNSILIAGLPFCVKHERIRMTKQFVSF